MKIKDILENCEKKEGSIYSFLKILEKGAFDYYKNINSWFNFDDIENNKFKVFNLYKDMFDERRGIWLNVAYYEDKLIAFWYAAGREGEDSYNGYVINKTKFIEGIKYLEELSEEINIEEVSEEEDIEEINYIYGTDMSKKIMDINLNLKYKKK